MGELELSHVTWAKKQRSRFRGDMLMKAKYKHTNIVARDWQALAGFYETVFGCTRVPPERHLSGEWLASGTGVADARFSGVHLRMPGNGTRGPTLEIYQYAVSEL